MNSPQVVRARGGRTASGFTIVELLVAIVIGTVLIGSIYQVLLTNQRVAAHQREEVLGQQTVRSGLDLLAQELREISVGGGDLTTIEATRIAFRAPRAFGLSCAVVNSVPPDVTVTNEGRVFAVGDSINIFADGNSTIATDDQWFAARITAVVDGETCGTDSVPAQTISLSAPGTQANSDLILQGAMVRGWEGIAYELDEVDGVTYLVRTVGGSTSRLVGPLSSSGLSFVYLDEDGDPTATATDVARIGITLRTLSEARDSEGNQVTDSLSTSVFLRN